MSIIQKIEDVLHAAGSDIKKEDQAVVAWFQRLIHHHKAGDIINPPPQTGAATVDSSTLVGGGNALLPPAPIPAPAPVAPVQSVQSPVTGTYRNGMTLLPDFSVMPDKMKQFAKEDPNWGPAAGLGDPTKAVSGWIIVDALETFKDLIPTEAVTGIYKQGFDAAFVVMRGMNEPDPKACYGWINKTNVCSLVDNEGTGARCTLADLDTWRANLDKIYAAQTDPTRKATVYPQVNHNQGGVVGH